MKKLLLVTISLLLAGNALQAREEKDENIPSKKNMVQERVRRACEALYQKCDLDYDDYYGRYYLLHSRRPATDLARVKKICYRPCGNLGKRN